MIEAKDALTFRELMGEHSRLMDDILVKRYVSEAANLNYPDAPPTVTRSVFRVRAEIAPYPLTLIHQSGAVLRSGDLRILCAVPLIGSTGRDDAEAANIRADIVVWKKSMYMVYNLPASYPIDGGHTLWAGTLRLLSGVSLA